MSEGRFDFRSGIWGLTTGLVVGAAVLAGVHFWQSGTTDTQAETQVAQPVEALQNDAVTEVSENPSVETAALNVDGLAAPTRQAITRLQSRIQDVSPDGTLAFYAMPQEGDLANIPQDAKNPLTLEKIALGQMLFHDTALGLEAKGAAQAEWSCSTCHHTRAGFKPGSLQGIGEGGSGFGRRGEARVKAETYDPADVDVQPFATPTVLNGAYQSVALWNGQLGNSEGGPNSAVDVAHERVAQPVVAANAKALQGLETQPFAGGPTHRLRLDRSAIVAAFPEYRAMFEAAFGPDTDAPKHEVAMAIAAYERSLLANRAPFQRWLHGDASAMTLQQLRGADVFFGKGNCVACHQGPAFSSTPDADAGQVFFAIGLADLDINEIVGTVSDKDRLGRAAFTGNAKDNYKFKIQQLYNLTDANVFGHGASFQSLADIIAYKNEAVPQADVPPATLDRRFRPLGLTENEMSDLEAFLAEALHDPELDRYAPAHLPSNACTINADAQSRQDLGCVPQDQTAALAQ